MRRNSNEWVESDAWKSTMSESGFGKIQATPKKKIHVDDEHRTHVQSVSVRVFASDAHYNVYKLHRTQFYKSVRMNRSTMELNIVPISLQRIRNNSNMRTWCMCDEAKQKWNIVCVYENEAAHRRNCLAIAQTKANKMKNTKMVHDAILARCTSITHSHLNSLKSMFAAHLNCCYDLFMHLYRLLHVKRTNKSAHTHILHYLWLCIAM